MSDWNEILNERALEEFAALTGQFHDGCVKELRWQPLGSDWLGDREFYG